MKRRYSFAALGYFEYLKTKACSTLFSTAISPDFPFGNGTCWMSLASSCCFASVDVFAAYQIEIPFAVTLSSPERKALLFDGSCQVSVPGTKVSYISLPYSKAWIVSGELMTT